MNVFSFNRRMAESMGIFTARMTLGDEALYEQSKDKNPDELSRFVREHRNQSLGIVESWQDAQTDDPGQS